MLEVKLLLLVICANGAPIIAHNFFRHRFNTPIDTGRRLVDGQRLLGASKTWRGLVSSFALSTSFAWLLGFPWWVGALVASGAMLGDLASSFIKRRLRLPESSMALGLDQIPESLLPILFVREVFDLGAFEVTYLVAGFFVAELVLSKILFKLHLRRRPY